MIIAGGVVYAVFYLFDDDDKGYTNAIEEVLIQDNNASIIGKDACEVADAMNWIDTSKCPKDFQYTYDRHIYAWRHACSADIAMNTTASKSASDEISATWYKVEQVAEEYGANVDILDAKSEHSEICSKINSYFEDNSRCTGTGALEYYEAFYQGDDIWCIYATGVYDKRSDGRFQTWPQAGKWQLIESTNRFRVGGWVDFLISYPVK